MNKTVRWSFSSLLTAGALGASLLQAPAASAVAGFVCPTGSDTIPVPYATTAAGVPLMAGTVCVFQGTTAYRLVDMNAGWRVEVKSVFGSTTTDVRFYNPTTGGKVELIYKQLGKIEIKV